MCTSVSDQPGYQLIQRCLLKGRRWVGVEVMVGQVVRAASQVPRTPSADHLRQKKEQRGSKGGGEREEGKDILKTKHKNLRPHVSQGDIQIPCR